MTSFLVLLLIAVAAGIAVALQGQFMGVMDRTAGTVTSMLLTYGAGAAVALLIWLVRRPPVAPVRAIPPYAFTAGLLGLVIIGGIGYASPRLGLSRTLVISVATQLIAAMLIEHFGLFGANARAVDASRAAGLALTIAGVWLAVRG